MGEAHVNERPTRQDWGRIWFGKLQQFHQPQGAVGHCFNEGHVTAFLRSKRDLGVPAWKRLKIVEGLIFYRDRQLQAKNPQLEGIRTKLKQIVMAERETQNGGPTIEEAGRTRGQPTFKEAQRDCQLRKLSVISGCASFLRRLTGDSGRRHNR